MVRLQSISVAEVDDSLIDIASRAAAEAVVVDLVGHISTQTAALWACRATAGIVNAILDAQPNDSAPTAFLYRSDFKSP
jgi:NADPH-dependent ferric siderophore reductase